MMHYNLIEAPRRKRRGIFDPIIVYFFALANPCPVRDPYGTSSGECARRIQSIVFIFSLITITGCKPSYPNADIFLAQGIMVGEVTTTSAILQTRLTASPGLINGDVPGQSGMARFEVDVSPEFNNSYFTGWMKALPENDFIIKLWFNRLSPGTKFYFRVLYSEDMKTFYRSSIASFNTLPGKENTKNISFVVVTGMNYGKFLYGEGNRDNPGNTACNGSDKDLGFPALEAILALKPDFLVATGDNVYYDSPAGEKWIATTEIELRRKWHEQFIQPRFVSLFSGIPVYWEKDDHDFRFNDCDTTGLKDPVSRLGISIFREQVPVTDPTDPDPKTYRTHRINKHLQIWFAEGRDYRSPNTMPDSPEKTLWGKEQLDWLKETLLASDADFKILVSPTPLIGPDDSYKKDNHTNPGGFRQERDRFFNWLNENNFTHNNFIIICGDRHWQYHSIHPSGFEEFSCGALVDANSRDGRLPGDSESTDPEGTIIQPYVQGPGMASGGFLKVDVKTENDIPFLWFNFYNEKGEMLYTCKKLSSDKLGSGFEKAPVSPTCHLEQSFEELRRI